MKVPYTNFSAHHATLKDELHRVIFEVINSGNFSGGAVVEQFEHKFAAYCGIQHAIGVGSGTEALWLALKAMEIGPGDEVITVPMSFFATAEAISVSGARPVFVDIDPVTYTMDPESLRAALTSRTKAIIPVHLFGQTADMAPIEKFAMDHGLYLIEDAAQCHGATYQDRKAGTIGHAGCFSFYPGKNLGAFGEAGAVVTHDEYLAEKIRALRDHGQLRKNEHQWIGWNSRMDAIQGAVLTVKLESLDANNRFRQNHASFYREMLSDVEEIVLPDIGENRNHVYHIYAIQTNDRQSLVRHLVKNEIGYGIHYPIPIHLQPAYQHLGLKRGAFPVAEHCADSFISLPIFPELTSDQLDKITETVREGLSRPQQLFARCAMPEDDKSIILNFSTQVNAKS